MALAAGSRLGPYEIVARLGAGGMGEVYRARDTRLDRDVAVKVLAAHHSGDSDLRQRFEREARVISSLNHPHICVLHDVGEAAAPDSRQYLVMELLGGETLADRLTRGPLPVPEALTRGVEIADALHAAHRHGIVHRDLKPGNVMLTRTGAKLLDFGIAKPGARAARLHGLNDAEETVASSDITAGTTIVGTVQYMAPEQLEGLAVDARADIFAFGLVLFEMITGRKAFAARTETSLIGAILKDQPPAVSSVVAVTPALDRAIAKCLAKDPDDRWQDAGDLRDELRWIASDGPSAGARTVVATGPRRREWLAWAIAAAALAGAAAVALPTLRRPSPPPVVRFTMPPPAGVRFAPVGAPVAPFPAVSPDGTRLVFVAARGDQAPTLWVRSLDAFDARPIENTTVRTDTLSPALPFWSPDSRTIGFFADGKLKRVATDGSSLQTICDAPQSGGASWGADDTIVFASKIDEGIRKVAASGGVPMPVTQPDRERGELAHSNPAFLPDGRHFLFWVQAPAPSIWVGSVDSPVTQYLFDADSRPVYGSGYVIYVRQSTLFAHPFDTTRLAPAGEPVPIAEDVRTFPLNGRSAFSVSSTGVLVYRTGSARSGLALAWRDRQGRQLSVVPDSIASYGGVSPAADDRHLIAQIDEGSTSDLWMIDLVEGTRSRITSGGRSEGSPVLSPDGLSVVFASDRYGIDDLFRMRVDGAGDEQVVVKSRERKYPTHWSAHWITLTVFDPTHKQDLWVLEPGGEARPYLQTEFNERDGRLSPDERWMLYVSDEAGPDAVYLRPFPDANGGKWRVSRAGAGIAPRWRADGREIFYADDTGRLVAVGVTLGAQSPALGVPQPLWAAGTLARSLYAVSRDGTRFLVPVRTEDGAGDVPLSIVLNWPAMVRR